MPSTYAHYRMGQEVRNKVGEKEKEIIEAYPRLFLIGLHGPDILFYYKPLTVNSVNQTGYRIHEKTGRDFFINAARVIKKHSGHKAYLAYVYGVICHFALDVTCHGYIDEKIAKSGVSHTEIEVELDRKLMIMDGCNPVRHRLTNHIKPSEKNSQIIQEFYENINKEQIKKALEGMIINNNLLVAPSKVKRYFIYSLLKISGNYKEMHGLIVNYKKNPNCIDSTEMLLQLYKKAEKLAVQLINEYKDFLRGKHPLQLLWYLYWGLSLERFRTRKATKIIPTEQAGEYFGLMDICGKGASFVGTTIVSAVSQLTGSVNKGVAVIAVLFVIGIILFRTAVKMDG